MWFKNLIIYRLNRDLALSADDLRQQLAPLAYHPCGSQDMMKVGWVPPMGHHSDALTHVSGNQILICAKKEDKMLPSPVIKQELQDKIERLESEQGRKLKKTEKDSLKDEVVHLITARIQ